MRWVKPPALPAGGTMAVVAPSSPPQTRSEIEQATDDFESLGHTVVFGPHHRKVHGYLAGVDAQFRLLAVGALVLFAVALDQWIRRSR